MSEVCGLCGHGIMSHWVQYEGPTNNPTRVWFVCRNGASPGRSEGCGCQDYIGVEELFRLLKRVLRKHGHNVPALIREALGQSQIEQRRREETPDPGFVEAPA